MDLALQPARPGWRVTPTQVVLAGLLYFLTARASLALIAQPTAIAAIWPPSGLLLGLLLLAAVDSWALLVGAVAVAITLANLLAGNGPLVSAGFAVANCAESLLAASLVRAVHPAPLTMTRLRHVSVLFVVAVVGSNAVTALLGAAVAALALGAPFWGAWLGWWVADGLGMLLVGAAILALANPRRGDYLPGGRLAPAEGLALAAVLIALAALIFSTPGNPFLAPSPYLIFPVLLWAAVRFGPPGAALAALMLAVTAVLLTARSAVLSAPGFDLALRILEVQAFLIVASVTALVMAALTAERYDAQAELERANAELEGRVAERTGALAASNEQLSDEIRERARTAERARRLQLLAGALSAALTPRQVATVVVEQGTLALGATAGSVVTLAADDPTQLEIIQLEGYNSQAAQVAQRFPLAADLPLTEAFRSGEAIWVESRAELLERYPHIAGTPMINQSFVVLPLVAHGRVLGCLGLSFREARQFDDNDRATAAILADLCAQALERSRLYEAAEQARESAETALRLREQFLSIASHELKTPLTAMLGNAQLLRRRLQRRGGMQEAEAHNLDVVVGQATRLTRLIAMLLDVTRIEGGRLTLLREPTDLGALVRRSVEELQAMSPRHQIVATLPAAGPILLADELRLEQVVLNLLQNAVKYSPRGGVVTVRLEADAGVARLLVGDSGIGIPADDVPQLFERFFRASNTESQKIAGLGVGLYVVREIVELHGGAVEVASEEGAGSTFTVTIPLSPAADAEPALTPAADAAPPLPCKGEGEGG